MTLTLLIYLFSEQRFLISNLCTFFLGHPVVLGPAVLLAIIPVNALILLLEIKVAVFAALLLKKEPSQIPTTAGRIFRDPQKQWNRPFVKNCSGNNNTKSW